MMTMRGLVTWWCGVFGITDPRVLEVAFGVVAGGSLLLVAYFIISLLLSLLGREA
ncbi:MAG: hypothetical protein J2P54_19070 [Bradyrhizobiaceae bacterium]|nr:hypothetical protein [Bradyrhizobiaceae bacterium]